MAYNRSIGYVIAFLCSETFADGLYPLLSGNVNWQALQNFAAVTLDDLPKIGKAVTESFYGTSPKYSYWNGCSTGGRQGMMGAQRYPKNYHGILAMAPVINWNEFLPSEIWAYLAMKKEKYAPPICELEVIQKAAVASCDELDGVKVSEVRTTVQRRVSDRLFVGRRGSRSRPVRL